MPTLKKATIKSYSASTHKAAVQIAGSLAVWLAAVPVATDIPAAEVVAGRECAVLFFTEDNPDDAVVVTVHGAVPAAVDHGALSGLGDDDHPQYETSAEAQAKVDAHAAAGDPHPVYETSAEAQAKVDTHAAAADPHTGYQKESEKGAASGYAGLDAGTKVPTVQLGGAGADATKFLRGDQSWAAAGGGGTSIADADADTKVETEKNPDEDKIRLTVAAVETLLIQTATPHVKATGYVRIYPPAGQSNGGLGIGTDADSTHPLSILATGTHAGGVMQIATLNTSSLVLQGSVASLVGLYGLAPASVQNATTGHIFQGLNFAAIINGADAAAVAADLTGCRAQAGQFGFKGTITLNRQFYAPSPYNVAPGAAMSFTLAIGYDADDQGANSAKVVDAISYRAAEIKGNTGYRRLLELGKNPELRLESGDPSNPGADKGRSQLLLTFNENGVIAAVRRIEWKLQSTLVAGDKVLVAV